MREVFKSAQIHSGLDFDEVFVVAMVPEDGGLTKDPSIRLYFTFRWASGREEKESMHMTRAAAERLQSALGTALMMTASRPPTEETRDAR